MRSPLKTHIIWVLIENLTFLLDFNFNNFNTNSDKTQNNGPSSYSYLVLIFRSTSTVCESLLYVTLKGF